MNIYYIDVLQSTHIKCDDVDITYVIDWYGISKCHRLEGICNMVIDNVSNTMIGE